jgi:hypothetical protein
MKNLIDIAVPFRSYNRGEMARILRTGRRRRNACPVPVGIGPHAPTVESGAPPSAMILFMIILEPASADAIDVILKAEADARAGRFLIGDTREAHEAAFRNPDVAYLSAFTLPPTADDRRWVGFVLLKGLSSRNKSIELKRIIVVDPGRGYGRAVMLARLGIPSRSCRHIACSSMRSKTTHAPAISTAPSVSARRACNGRRSDAMTAINRW